MTESSRQGIRALVVDDSALYRKVVRDLLVELPDVAEAMTARNGRVALELIRTAAPDFVTLDVEMPEVNGLEVLRAINAMTHPPGVVMLSGISAQGAKATTESLALGAFDFVVKPQRALPEESVEQLRRDLLPRVEAWIERHRSVEPQAVSAAGPLSRSAPRSRACDARPIDTTAVAYDEPAAPPMRTAELPERIEVLAIGVSTGGPAALIRMLPQLPADLPVPVLIVQHMPAIFTRTFADDLHRASRLEVAEAADGAPLRGGRVLLAPGGRQMKVVREGGLLRVAITDDPPERSCRPAVDYLFRSIAHVCGGAALAVVMTGMGDDGTLGCRLLKRRGAYVIAQDAASCVVYGMPRSVVEARLADEIVPLDALADRLVEILTAVTAA